MTTWIVQLHKRTWIMGALVTMAGCASISPGEEVRNKLLLEAARECAGTHGVQVSGIDQDGRLHYTIVDHDRARGDRFAACWQERVRAKIKSAVSGGHLSRRPGSQQRTTVPIKLVERAVLVKVTVNETVETTLLLDTGAAYTVIHPPVLERLNMTLAPDAVRLPLRVVGGTLIAVPFARLRSLKVGNLAVEELDAGVYDALQKSRGVDGLLGADFLNHFKVTVDRASQQLTLEVTPPSSGRP